MICTGISNAPHGAFLCVLDESGAFAENVKERRVFVPRDLLRAECHADFVNEVAVGVSAARCALCVCVENVLLDFSIHGVPSFRVVGRWFPPLFCFRGVFAAPAPAVRLGLNRFRVRPVNRFHNPFKDCCACSLDAAEVVAVGVVNIVGSHGVAFLPFTLGAALCGCPSCFLVSL